MRVRAEAFYFLAGVVLLRLRRLGRAFQTPPVAPEAPWCACPVPTLAVSSRGASCFRCGLPRRRPTESPLTPEQQGLRDELAWRAAKGAPLTPLEQALLDHYEATLDAFAATYPSAALTPEVHRILTRLREEDP